MRNVILVIVCLFLVLVLTACNAGDSTSNDSYQASGKVYNAITNHGVADVNLKVEGSQIETYTASTDDNGNFTLSDLQGTVTITPTKRDTNLFFTSKTISTEKNNLSLAAHKFLREVDADFKVGVAVTSQYFDESKYQEIVTREFNSLSAEYEFKQAHVNPAQGEYNWKAVDRISRIAEENDMRLFVHALAWHRSVPDWMKDLPAAEFETALENWVKEMTSHLGDQPVAYDVVNEAFEYPDNGKYRKSVFYEKLGPEYIKKMFQWAEKYTADDTLLFYNDTGLCFNGPKLDSALEMIREINSEEQLIDGIGFQMHLVKGQLPDLETIRTAFNRAADMGLKIHVSEFDLAMNPNGSYGTLTDDLAYQQQEKIKEIVSLYNELPVENKFGFTFWGLKDDHSWLNNVDYLNFDPPCSQWPLLFDKDFAPKPALYGFIEGIQE